MQTKKQVMKGFSQCVCVGDITTYLYFISGVVNISLLTCNRQHHQLYFFLILYLYIYIYIYIYICIYFCCIYFNNLFLVLSITAYSHATASPTLFLFDIIYMCVCVCVYLFLLVLMQIIFPINCM